MYCQLNKKKKEKKKKKRKTPKNKIKNHIGEGEKKRGAQVSE